MGDFTGFLDDPIHQPHGGALVYRGIVSQAGTDTPVVTVLENTFHVDPVWARTSAGVYTITLAGAWTSGKTWASIGGVFKENAGDFAIGEIARTSANVLTARTYDVILGTATLSASDDILTGSSFEIRVFP